MKENSYGIEYIQICDNLGDLKIGKYHYNYKKIDFMFNYKEKSTKLLIAFHARVDIKDKIPIFHKYNYENEEISVLAISDKLLEKYQHINSTCFWDLPGEFYHNKYIEIIKHVAELLKCEKNIFYGSCSGALPAFYFGCIFKGIIFCTNAFIYYDDFLNVYNKRAGLDSNTFICPNVEQEIMKSKPLHIYLYVNKCDNFNYQQNIKFIKFCKEHIPEKITYKIHEKSDGITNCHLFYFPEDENFNSILKSI